MFADLAGYTALTDVHGDQEAIALLDDYLSALRALVAEHGGSEVKSIGDALLVRAPDAEQALLLGLRATTEIGARHGSPSVRVGMHHGEAIEREGDYFGQTVNIAARVSALASAGEVLVTGAARDAAGEVEGVRFHQRGLQRLRGISEPVSIYLASSGTAAELPIDPVCRMAVDPERAAGALELEGVRYHFCSLDCARRFAEQPEHFVLR
jgi:adenylate cyclase